MLLPLLFSLSCRNDKIDLFEPLLPFLSSLTQFCPWEKGIGRVWLKRSRDMLRFEEETSLRGLNLEVKVLIDGRVRAVGFLRTIRYHTNLNNYNLFIRTYIRAQLPKPFRPLPKKMKNN